MTDGLEWEKNEREQEKNEGTQAGTKEIMTKLGRQLTRTDRFRGAGNWAHRSPWEPFMYIYIHTGKLRKGWQIFPIEIGKKMTQRGNSPGRKRKIKASFAG